jgi:hypothetical protein
LSSLDSETIGRELRFTVSRRSQRVKAISCGGEPPVVHEARPKFGCQVSYLTCSQKRERLFGNRRKIVLDVETLGTYWLRARRASCDPTSESRGSPAVRMDSRNASDARPLPRMAHNKLQNPPNDGVTERQQHEASSVAKQTAPCYASAIDAVWGQIVGLGTNRDLLTLHVAEAIGRELETEVSLPVGSPPHAISSPSRVSTERSSARRRRSPGRQATTPAPKCRHLRKRCSFCTRCRTRRRHSWWCSGACADLSPQSAKRTDR